MNKLISIFAIAVYLNATVYFGEGSGDTYEEAKKRALEDVASKISVIIDSKMERSSSLINDDYEKRFKEYMVQKTNVELQDYEIVARKEKDGKFWVKVRYDNAPSLDRFASKTPYTKEQIKESIKRDFGKSLGLELVRKDKQWYIKYKDILQKLDKKDFYTFFKTTKNRDLKFSLHKKSNLLYDGEKFSFLVSSTKDGYVTIFDVYEDGTVSILAKNLKVERKKSLTFPNRDSQNILEASLLQSQKETFDMYIALFSKKKMLFDEFVDAYEDILDEELYKNFDELIELLKDKNYSSIKVIIRPR